MKNSLKKYLVELIGAFFLMFTVASAVALAGNGVIPAISIGFVLMVLVYAGGHVSGGHYNPAVSLAAAIRGALEWKHLVPYWIAQLLGGSAAAYLALQFAKLPADTCTACTCPFTICQLVTGEFLFTFLLCWVVLHVATCKKTEGNSYYGLAIGSVVTVGAFAVGGILCEGAFNPAVALGLGVLGAASWCLVIKTIIINLVAGICAAIAYKMTEIE